MKVAFFNTKNYERDYFTQANQLKHDIQFITEKLDLKSVNKAIGANAVCCFVTDCLDENIIKELAKIGIQLIALRSAGYDHVNLTVAKSNHITVVNVPKYSPQAVAEFAVALILALSRHVTTAFTHGLQNNFSLDGLLGFNLHQKCIGIIGTGNIGTAFARIMNGFGCSIIAYDSFPNDECKAIGVQYVDLNFLFNQSDIISLHCPLNDKTRYIVDKDALKQMKKNAMLINTGRGGLINTAALITALEQKQIGYAGLDVYEKENNLFFIDHANNPINDDLFLKLYKMPNVLITPHQGFFTHEAVENISQTTIANITAFENGKIINQVI